MDAARQDNALVPRTTLCKGKYTIEKVLGRGGFGITYRAVKYDGNIRQYYAIKEFFMANVCERNDSKMTYSQTQKGDIEAGLKSFIKEAERLNSVNIHHDNIVGINEVFRENGTAYYVMEYIKGKDLKNYIKEYGPMPEDKALDVLRPIFNALAVLHANMITHLDIKPANILLNIDEETQEIRPVLIDFGLSKHYDRKGEATSMVNLIAFSHGYSPNEQYQGCPSEFSPQSDVYSLAATLFYLLTGKTPEMAAMMTQDKILAGLPPTVSDTTRDAIVHAMKPLKDDRTQSVMDFADELKLNITNNHLDDATVPMGNLSAQVEPKTTGGVNKTKLMIIVGAVLVLGLGAWGISKIDFSGGASAQPQSAEESPATEVVKQSDEELLADDANDESAETDKTAEDNQLADNTPKDDKTAAAAPEKAATSEKATTTKNQEVASTTTKTAPAQETPKKEAAADKPTTGTVSTSYGTWTGGIKNGKPHGKGTMRITSATTIAGFSLEPGYRIDGMYENGRLSMGAVYDQSGTKLRTLVP